VPRVKYAMDYRPTDSFSMSYASRKVIFPGDAIGSDHTVLECEIAMDRQKQADYERVVG
jgi:hypothetical protein